MIFLTGAVGLLPFRLRFEPPPVVVFVWRASV